MNSDKESLSFGRYLQAIRLEKKISLEKVSAQTRIGLGNLLLIEQEDYEGLPAEVFVKGFLRSFAVAIGADGDEAIRRYESRLDVVQKIAESEASFGKHGNRMWQNFLISLLLLSCIILISIIGYSFFRDQPDIDKQTLNKAAAEKEQIVATRDQQKAVTEVMPDRVIPKKLSLQITTLEDTWLKVIVDEKELTEYTLKSGDRLELEATSGYNLLIGNASGLKIKLNDKPVSIIGKSGQVVNLHLP